jgi:hypothetical protein
MPRKTEQILEHAEELAQRFEDYEPRPEDAVEVTALRLVRRAVAHRAQAERELIYRLSPTILSVTNVGDWPRDDGAGWRPCCRVRLRHVTVIMDTCEIQGSDPR